MSISTVVERLSRRGYPVSKARNIVGLKIARWGTDSKSLRYLRDSIEAVIEYAKQCIKERDPLERRIHDDISERLID